VIDEVDYLSDPSQVVLIAGSAQAIARVNRQRVPVVVVTNQSGVARGYFPESRVGEVHKRLSQLLAEHGAHIDRYYFCPHHPTEGVGPYRISCQCRKPRRGMLLRAAEELGLDLARSVLVGDKLSDLEAGSVCASAILVRTGYGASLFKSLNHSNLFAVSNDLAEAVALRLPSLLAFHDAA
jgi:D-glycero-D-manno-heptose 1,7-bisphosphate phosphatase